MKRSHLISLAVLFVLLLLIWLLPKDRSKSASKSLLEYEPAEVTSIEYKSEKQHFSLKPRRHPSIEDSLVWKVETLEKEGKKTNAQFFASTSVDSMVKDMAFLKYTAEIDNDPGKHQEYGLEGCTSYAKLAAEDETHHICLGKPNYNKTKKHIWPKGSDKIYIVSNYLFNRYDNDIFSKINKKAFLYDAKKIEALSIRFDKKVTSQYPMLFPGKKNSLELFRKEKENKKGSSSKSFKWEITAQPQALHAYSSGIKSLLTQLNMAFVAQEIKKPPQTPPVVEVNLYQGKGESKKNIGSYKLWEAPYPSGISFVPSQKKKDPSPRDHSVIISDTQSGVYSRSQLKTIHSRLQNMEDTLKREKEKQKREEESRKIEEEKQKKEKINQTTK